MALWCTILLKLSLLLLSFENKSINMPHEALEIKLHFLNTSFASKIFAVFSSECYCFKFLIYHNFNECNNTYK